MFFFFWQHFFSISEAAAKRKLKPHLKSVNFLNAKRSEDLKTFAKFRLTLYRVFYKNS